MLCCIQQVAFKYFYSGHSSGDKCTLFSDRNLINRRNVKEDVDAEVKARLMTATMQVLGMEDLQDTPRGEFFQPNLHDAVTCEKKEYLRKVASRVIDEFVVRKEKVEAIPDNLLSAEEEEANNRREQTENGRFICPFPGCGKTFAHNGKRMRNHEATHNAPVSVVESEGQVLQAPVNKTPEKDDMFNYQCSFLEYGMIIHILRSWKFQLPYLKKDPGSTKYALETLEMLFQVYGLLSPKAAHELVWNDLHCL